MSNAAIPEIEIFRAGRHVAVDGSVHTITHDDLAAVAAAYDPAIGEAPHVIGHPALGAPAYGWVSKLEARDGVLLAKSAQVDAAFASIVNEGRYKKRSASFFMPESPGNPKPGAMYLNHVGWLGAAAPAVSGLRDVQFAGDQAGIVEFGVTVRPWTFRTIADVLGRIRDYFVERDGVEKTDQVLPRYMIESIADGADVPDQAGAISSFAAPSKAHTTPEKNPMSEQTADFAARESALNNRQQQLEARETALRDNEGKARRSGIVEFAAALVKQGRILPRQQAPIVELLATLEGAAEPATISFAAPDGQNTTVQAGAALRTFLGELPVQVDFLERSGDADRGGAGSVDFAAPQGTQVNRERLDLHAKALEYQRTHAGADYITAVRAVGG